MEILVGYTGFVGGNILEKHTFDSLYNSKNIIEAFDTHPDLLVYSGVPAEMFLANSNPSADLAVCENAARNICKIAPKRVVLISSIAVLDNTNGTDEEYTVNATKLKAYGANRYHLEKLVQRSISDCHIIRLPALFGKGLKKNFIYDIINFVPAMLKTNKYIEFSAKEPLIDKSYTPLENGFHKLKENSLELKEAFSRVGFSALNFTDSRSVFQFYNLANLWQDIEIMLRNNIPLLHLATEPLSASEVYTYVTGKKFINETANPYNYNYCTKYANLFGRENGYLYDKEKVLKEIKEFVERSYL